MAIQHPGIGFLRGYDKPDIVRKFAEGHGFGRGLRDEEAAGELIKQLIGLGQEAPAGPSGAPVPSSMSGVFGSEALANGAADTGLAEELMARLAGGASPTKIGFPGAPIGEPAGNGIPETYVASVANAESGGDPNARNPNSTAAGEFQFLEGTWNDLMSRHPDLGLTPDGRTDPDQSRRAMGRFTGDNAKALRQAGLNVTPGNLYAAHFLGSGAAPKVLAASRETPMTALVSPETIAANPHLADMTQEEFVAWANTKGGNANGGYAPPASGSSPQRQVAKPSGELMAALMTNRTTRPLAEALMAQQGKTVDQWQQFTGPDGKQYQVNLADGKVDAIGGGGVTVNNGGEGSYDKRVNEKLADMFIGTQDASTAGLRTMTSLDAMEAAMDDPNFYSGFAAEPVLGVKRLVSSLGLDPSAATSTESFNSLSKQAALDVMGGSLGTGFSNADRDFVIDQVPNLGNTPQGNRQLIELHRALAQRKVDIGRLAETYAEQNGGRLDGRWNSYLADWAEKNPLFDGAAGADDGEAGDEAAPDLPDPFGAR